MTSITAWKGKHCGARSSGVWHLLCVDPGSLPVTKLCVCGTPVHKEGCRRRAALKRNVVVLDGCLVVSFFEAGIPPVPGNR